MVTCGLSCVVVLLETPPAQQAAHAGHKYAPCPAPMQQSGRLYDQTTGGRAPVVPLRQGRTGRGTCLWRKPRPNPTQPHARPVVSAEVEKKGEGGAGMYEGGGF